MKKTNMDLTVGASILIALFVLIGGVLWLKDSLVARKTVSYTVLFPNVGTLQLGDPVMTNGVTKGRVKYIYLRNDRVAAVITLERDVSLTDSSVIRVQNIGLMGERGIGILLSDKGARYKSSSKKDTTFCFGSFDTGIAEAMGMMGVVLSEVDTLLTTVAGILHSTVGDTAFLTLFHTLVNRLDTLTYVAERLVRKNGPLIDNSVRNLSAASTRLRDLLDKNSGHIDAIMANGDQLTSYSLTLMTRIEALTASVQSVLHEIENGQGALGMLIKDEQFSQDLRRTVADVDTLVNEVQNDALKLRLKLFGKKKK